MSLISKVKLPGQNTPYDIGVQWDNVKEKPDFYPAAAGIPYGEVDSTSTATAFTATVPGITELKDGVCMLLRNGVVTSASGFTININGLGAKPSYNNMATGNDETPTTPTRDTTIFNINYTMLFIYNESLVSGGCWICYRGYDGNTNTIGYQVRTNSMRLPVSDQTGRYRLLFTSADHTHFVPANTSNSTSATTAKTVNQRPIDPFGSIRYYGYTTVLSAGTNVGAGYLWQQYVVTMGYSFSDGSVSMTAWHPVYLKCAPQTDGSAIIDATDPYVQILPTTEDGKIYIYLGVANAATTFELTLDHPVYQYKNGAIRLYTNEIDNFGAIRISSDALSVPANAESISPNSTIVLNKIAKTGSYTDLLNRPTNISAFTNDANYVTQTQLNNATAPSSYPHFEVDYNNNTFSCYYVGSLPDNVNSVTTALQCDEVKYALRQLIPVYNNGTQVFIGSADIIDIDSDIGLEVRFPDATVYVWWLVNGLKGVLTYDSSLVHSLYLTNINTTTPHWWSHANNVVAEGIGTNSIGSSTTPVYWTGSGFAETATIPTVPTQVSAFTNDSGYITSAGVATNQVLPDWNATSGKGQILNKPNLASVATSGNYNDLTNKPTMPTVNDATLTIQKNGDTVNTFTANASTDVTVNITALEAPLIGQAYDSTAANYLSPTDVMVAIGAHKLAFVIYLNGTSQFTFTSWSYLVDETDELMAVIGSISTYALIGTILDGWSFHAIDVPTSTAALSNDGDDWEHPFLATDDVATVATTGNYNDLLNKPTIPTFTDVSAYTSGGQVSQVSFTSGATFTIAEGTVTANSAYQSGGTISQTPFGTTTTSHVNS